MASFYVESLFTNIPLDECIDLAVRFIKEENTDIKLSATELKTLLRFATAQTHFLFKDSFLSSGRWCVYGLAPCPRLSQPFYGA